MYLRRMNRAPPKMLQGFTFTVVARGNVSDLTVNAYVISVVVTSFVAIADPFAQDASVFHSSAQHHLLRCHHQSHYHINSTFRLRRFFRQRSIHTVQHDEHDV